MFYLLELVIWYRNDGNIFELSTNLFIIAWESQSSFTFFLHLSVTFGFIISLREGIWSLNANHEIKTAKLYPIKFVRIKSISNEPALFVY